MGADVSGRVPRTAGVATRCFEGETNGTLLTTPKFHPSTTCMGQTDISPFQREECFGFPELGRRPGLSHFAPFGALGNCASSTMIVHQERGMVSIDRDDVRASESVATRPLTPAALTLAFI